MINYTNPDRERFVNIAAMALFNVPANEEVTVVDIIDKDCKKDIKINIMLNALMEDNTDDIEKVVAFFHGNFGIWCHADLTKIDCDFPALVESLNF